MDHTYLRYECADSFGLTVAAASSKAPALADQIITPGLGDSILAVTGSTLTCWSSKGQGLWKWGHRNKIGTGESLNSDELVCIDVAIQTNGSMKVATGWVDGAVRIVDFEHDGQYKMTHSLIDKEDYAFSEPLELQGHNNSPVRCVVFDASITRLASGGSNGSIILWDLVAESGLFRLLGHKGAIKDIHFQSRKASNQDFIVSSSLDGLVKVWNLNEQCCTQTIANHQVSSGLCQLFHDDRCRLITGGLDGQLRVWSVHIDADASDVDKDTPCRYMGRLSRPANAVISNEKVVAIRASSGRHVGVLQASAKMIDVFFLRSQQECERKRIRRLRRRQEKQKRGAAEPEADGAKRGLLDEPAGSDVEAGAENKTEENLLDPSLLKASDEFEHLATVRSHHKIRSFCFGKKQQGERLRIVCALSTNAIEIHVLKRKTE
jgi:WD domain, G-beta repeat